MTKTQKDGAMRGICSCRVPGPVVSLLEPAEGELLIRTYDAWLFWKHAEEEHEPEAIHIPFDQGEQVVVADVGGVSYLVGGSRAVRWPVAEDAPPLPLPFELPFPANQFCPAPLQGVGDHWLFVEFDRSLEHWALRRWRPLSGRGGGSQAGGLTGEVETVARLLESSQPAHLLVSADGKVVCVTQGGELWVIDHEDARRMTFCPSGHPMRESISSTRPLVAVFSLGTAVEIIDTERLAVVDVLDFSMGTEPPAAELFAAGDDAMPVFHPLPSLDTEDVADLLQVIRVRVLNLLERRGVIEDRAGLTLLDDGFAEREPALAELAAAAVSGLLPAGPELRQRQAIALRGRLGVEVAAPLCVTELGFSLHAATRAGAADQRGRKALVRYALRPALAQERLQLLDSGLVRIQLRRPFRDGTVGVDLDPLSLLCRLAAAVPAPRSHTVRYAGVLGSASKWRALVVPPAPPADPTSAETAPRTKRPPTHRSGYRPWAELMKRTFAIDVETCPKCGARMKLRALITKPDSIERFLHYLGEPTAAPPRSAARDPPYFKSQAVRRKLGALDPPPSSRQSQGELFSA
mgnify:CR=1 FL=1